MSVVNIVLRNGDTVVNDISFKVDDFISSTCDINYHILKIAKAIADFYKAIGCDVTGYSYGILDATKYTPKEEKEDEMDDE